MNPDLNPIKVPSPSGPGRLRHGGPAASQGPGPGQGTMLSWPVYLRDVPGACCVSGADHRIDFHHARHGLATTPPCCKPERSPLPVQYRSSLGPADRQPTGWPRTKAPAARGITACKACNLQRIADELRGVRPRFPARVLNPPAWAAHRPGPAPRRSGAGRGS